MYEVIFLYALGLVWIIFASVQDLKTREVANWLSFSLIIFAIGFRFFYCLFFLENFYLFYQGLIWLGIFFGIGNLFYYSRVFAGGDAKLMIALGAVLPIYESFFMNFKIFCIFFLIFLFVGLIYTLGWSGVLAVKNWKKFKKGFFAEARKNKRLTYLAFILGGVIIFFGFNESMLIVSGSLIIVIPFFYFYSKSIDQTSMIKLIEPKNLTEGDWLYKDVKLGKRIIKADWDGLEKKDILLLRKKHRSVLIRQGIPFVPVFLISFLVLICLLYTYNIRIQYFLDGMF